MNVDTTPRREINTVLFDVLKISTNQKKKKKHQENGRTFLVKADRFGLKLTVLEITKYMNHIEHKGNESHFCCCS